MLYGYFKRGIFGLFQPSDVNNQITDKRQESGNRFQTSECEDSKEQFRLSTS